MSEVLHICGGGLRLPCSLRKAQLRHQSCHFLLPHRNSSHHPHIHKMISKVSERAVADASSRLLQTAKRQRISINQFAPAGTLASSNRYFSIQSNSNAPNQPSILGIGLNPSSSAPASYFQNQRPSLPANTIIRFVPQQTAWIVERMGKFNRILQPGLAILIPLLDRIAYVKSLKEAAIEIPSQSAITADNVTLELDGVLYTRVFDAYKARYES